MTATTANRVANRAALGADAGRTLESAARRLLVTLIVMSLGRPLPAQTSIEAAVMDSARRALQVDAGDSVWLDRSYSRAFYPDAVFYRTWYVPRGMMDVSPKPLALVAVSGRILLVQSSADLSPVWTAASVWKDGGRPDAFDFQTACSDLLLQTGLLGTGTRFIEALSEIPTPQRRALYPQTALKSVRPAEAWQADSGTRSNRYAWDNDLVMIRCALSHGGRLTVTIDTLADGAHNVP